MMYRKRKSVVKPIAGDLSDKEEMEGEVERGRRPGWNSGIDPTTWLPRLWERCCQNQLGRWCEMKEGLEVKKMLPLDVGMIYRKIGEKWLLWETKTDPYRAEKWAHLRRHRLHPATMAERVGRGWSSGKSGDMRWRAECHACNLEG